MNRLTGRHVNIYGISVDRSRATIRTVYYGRERGCPYTLGEPKLFISMIGKICKSAENYTYTVYKRQ